MQTDNPMISDFVKLLNSAAGTLAGMGREGRDAARERAREFLGGLDFVSREEFEAVKAMAATAREHAERLEARLAALEAVQAAPAAAKPGKAKPGAGITD
ncbi:MAG: accessory factor UbiK family protein [Novosphingobium sp.]|nr:accessory factor UbiK family protein [Novosphingobium sp.]